MAFGKPPMGGGSGGGGGLGFPPSMESQGPPKAAAPPPGAPPDDPMAGGGSSVTKDMLDYHGTAETCQSCNHFSSPDQCDRFGGDPVEAGGHCKGYEGAGADEGELLDNPTEEVTEPEPSYGAQ